MFLDIQKHHGGQTMTELEKAANNYANSIAQHDHNKVFSIDDFKAGAKWQKKQTSSGQAMKYLQEHHSPSEVSDFQAAMNIAVAKAIDSTINKSIEWLKDNIHYDDFGGSMEWYVPFAEDDEMVENFKKFMEELL